MAPIAKSTPTKKVDSPARKAITTVKRTSPGKSNKPIPVKKEKNRAPTLSVVSFGPPFTFEIYFFEKTETDDGFTHGITKQIRGEGQSHTLFDSANFISHLTRRIPGSDDVVMRNKENDYERRLFLRYPPERESTKETRESGLNAVRSFLMDPRFSRYPPTVIDLRDLTNYDQTDFPTPMDDYMMNNDIKEAIIQCCDETDLDDEFKVNFPETSMCLWQSQHVGEFGSSLGF